MNRQNFHDSKHIRCFLYAAECIITFSCSESITASQECGVAKHGPCRLSAPSLTKQPETLTDTLVKNKRFPKKMYLFLFLFFVLLYDIETAEVVVM